MSLLGRKNTRISSNLSLSRISAYRTPYAPRVPRARSTSGNLVARFDRTDSVTGPGCGLALEGVES